MKELRLALQTHALLSDAELPHAVLGRDREREKEREREEERERDMVSDFVTKHITSSTQQMCRCEHEWREADQ